ncbi:alkaline phosphatase D family protein [Kiloniella laminariae]|uniref:alkaline phosphatase D family protein n=1 Tax=Kiloniella laminariae TaxID=454162 RepID=UPI00036F1F98|nr:alkaline phosphatase D family protein [Kiloniella laminariae]
MKLILGPVLSLRNTSRIHWSVSVLLVTSGGVPDLEIVSGRAERGAVQELLSFKEQIVYRFDLRVDLDAAPGQVTYGFDGKSWSFSVPAAGADPQMVFVSCNGFSAPSEIKKVDDKNGMWKVLLNQHRNTSYNLMIMGGDQIYADEIWEKCPDIKKWVELPRLERRARKFTAVMRSQVERFYFELYCLRWKQSEVSEALATIPTVMMWDDHDIFDGWGSYAPEDQNCPVYQGIYEEARRHFAVFQQQLPDVGGEQHPGSLGTAGYSTVLRAGNYLILSLDARSERSQKQVLSRESWDRIWSWLENCDSAQENGPKHLLFVAPVPIVHADFGRLESLFGWFPGDQELEDDLRDHWQSPPHRKERLRTIHRMFDLMEKKSCRVTILSGDVHVACLGVIENERGASGQGREKVINQLTASGIVHPAPPKLMGWLLNRLSDEVETVVQGITARMMELPTKRAKYMLARNFLSLEPDDQSRLWANWYVEGEEEVITKVVHPILSE